MSRLPLPLSLRPFLPGRQSEGGRLLNNNPGMVLIIAGQHRPGHTSPVPAPAT